MIPDIVHHNQNAYVKGKPIFDAVRAIDDILEFTQSPKSPASCLNSGWASQWFQVGLQPLSKTEVSQPEQAFSI